MSNASEASYAKIGFFIVLGIALTVGVLVHIGGLGSKNSEFLEKLADALGEKGVLTMADVQEIRRGCWIVPVDV